jgi:imidazolonepropionase-like amidohydrolase
VRALACLLLSVVAGAGGDGDGLPRGTFAMRCGTLHAGDGSVTQNVWIVVREGRIAEVHGRDWTPGVLPVLDVADKVVIPGLIAADTDLAGQADQPQQLTPDLVALDGFDFSQANHRALSGGVTTVWLSPGRSRLMPGQGSAVKTAGGDASRRILRASCGLKITLGKESLNAPPLFEPTVAPTSDDPLLPSKRQLPSARLAQLAEVRRAFALAQSGDGGAADGGFAEDDWDPEPLRMVQRGELELRVAAREAGDLQRALQLARELKARVVLENPEQVDRVGALARELSAIATFRIPVRPGQSNPGGEDRRDKTITASPDAPARAAAAGLRVALSSSHDDDLRDLLLVASVAVRAGLDEKQALRAITADAAQALGVADRVGTLQPGKDADFCILSGPPFAIGTMVETTYVDGEPAFVRKTASKLLALRVGKAITQNGADLDRAVILIEDGRIRAIGEDLAIPHGAEVIALDDAVATPGFVDCHSHVGLAGDGAPVPAGAADQPVADAIATDDRWLLEACRAGVTTALVSGKDAGLVSGRVAAIKTAGATVLKPTAALRFVHDAIGPDSVKPLADAIGRGRQYVESWQRYEKALADWKAGKGEKPKDAPVTEAPKDDPVSGVWEAEVRDLPFPFPLRVSATLRLEGSTVTGSVVVTIQERRLPPTDIQDGKFESGKLSFAMRAMGQGTARVEATVQNDELTGTFDAGQFRGVLSGRRTSKDAAGAASAASTSGEPARPRVDENLEPIRLLLDQKIPAVVRCGRGPAITSIVQWFADQKLPLVLHGADDAARMPGVVGSQRPAVVVGPQVLEEEDGRIVNWPSRLADHGLPIAFATGDAAGSRHLGVHASLAVRYGLDPQEALRALTLAAAKMFKLDDRIGSLERGKDADIVVWSGSPLELTSRVLLVVVNGKVAADRRKERTQ